MTNHPLQSFLPVVGDAPRVLILGTMPGKESLRRQEYYAHSRNLFWKIVSPLFDHDPPQTYAAKTTMLKKNRIALWDVCRSAFRKSSLDSDIKSEQPNDIPSLIRAHPTIRLVAFNGQKAEKLYSKHFDRLPGVQYTTLLSTSPANASYTFDQKLADWRVILNP